MINIMNIVRDMNDAGHHDDNDGNDDYLSKILWLLPMQNPKVRVKVWETKIYWAAIVFIEIIDIIEIINIIEIIDITAIFTIFIFSLLSTTTLNSNKIQKLTDWFSHCSHCPDY